MPLQVNSLFLANLVVGTPMEHESRAYQFIILLRGI